MKLRLWIVSGILAAVGWSVWLVFTLAAWRDGPGESPEARVWRTVSLLAGAIATVTADRLRRD